MWSLLTTSPNKTLFQMLITFVELAHDASESLSKFECRVPIVIRVLRWLLSMRVTYIRSVRSLHTEKQKSLTKARVHTEVMALTVISLRGGWNHVSYFISHATAVPATFTQNFTSINIFQRLYRDHVNQQFVALIRPRPFAEVASVLFEMLGRWRAL